MMTAKPRKQLARRTVILTLLVLAGGLLAAGSATWVSATANPAVGGTVQVHVSGTAAAPAVGAAAVLVAAGALAVGLAGRWARRAVGVGVTLAGIVAGAATIGVLNSPESSALSAAASRIGVPQVANLQVTVAPWLTVVLSLIVAIAGVIIIIIPASAAQSARFEAPGTTTAPGATTAPGSLDLPEDAETVSQVGAPSIGAPAPSVAQMWDALNRGDDPTGPLDSEKVR